MTGEILFTVGDDPLSELMEMDMLYGWTRRIRRLKGLYEKKDNLIPWILILGMSSAMILGLFGFLVYMAFFA